VNHLTKHQHYHSFPWLSGQKGNFTQDMAQWIKEGKVQAQQESFTDGIENWPKAFLSLFGKNMYYISRSFISFKLCLF
jgi:hypothetical protein